MNLRDYRSLVLQQSYPGAAIDYAPMRDNWFVLSGIRDGVMFYERVTFTCGGRRINSWAMLYPVAERRFYDRIVEQVAPQLSRRGGATAGRYGTRQRGFGSRGNWRLQGQLCTGDVAPRSNAATSSSDTWPKSR